MTGLYLYLPPNNLPDSLPHPPASTIDLFLFSISYSFRSICSSEFFTDFFFHHNTPQYRMTETAFRQREKLIEKQKYFQSIHKHTHLKGPMDKITSVAIPLFLAGSSLFLIGQGIYHMSHGTGKKQ